jgi:ketosteroid isomerase-like protein
MSLERLLEQDRIQRLRATFAHALDAKDFALLGGPFADEVDADFSAYGLAPRRMTRAELVGLFAHAFRREGLKTHHVYANFVIDVRGETASVRSNFVGHHRIEGFAGGDRYTLYGQYRDVVTKTAEGWKISALTLVVFDQTGNPALVG